MSSQAPLWMHVTVQNGYAFESESFSSLGEIPLVRIRDIKADEFETYISKESITSPDFLIQNGDLVVGMDGDFNSVLWSKGEAALNQRVCIIKAKKSADIRFIYYGIQDKLKSINDLKFSTTVKHLSQDDIYSIRMYFPSLDTQKRIADYLDKEIAEIDAMVSALDDYVELLEKRKAKILIDGTGIYSTSLMTRLGRHAEIILGKTLQGEQKDPNEELVSYVRAGNIQPNGVFDGEEKQMWMSPKEKDHYEIRAGDVLVVEGGAGYGRSLTMENGLPSWGFQNHIIRIRARDGWVGQFIDFVIRAYLQSGHIEMLSVGATIPGFSSDRAKSLPVPFLSTKEQHQRATSISGELEKADAIIRECNELRDLLLTRRQVLISDVVSGKKEV